MENMKGVNHFALYSRKMAFTYLRVTQLNMCCHSMGESALVSYSSAAKGYIKEDVLYFFMLGAVLLMRN